MGTFEPIMSGGRRLVLTRLGKRAGGRLRAMGRVVIGAVLLALILEALAPRQGHALTIRSISTPTVSVPAVTVGTVTVPTVTVPKVTVPTVSVPTVTVPTVTVPPIADAHGSHGVGSPAGAAGAVTHRSCS